MGDLITREYELSVWKDVLEDKGSSYYTEERQCVIASNNMDSSCSASNIELMLSINNANSLSFEIYTKYFDIDINNYVDNPYYQLLLNEVHLKLKYGEEWYDFLIKEIEETDTEYKKIITATDMFVEELSKNGYSLEFNSELDNNTGSAHELVEKIVADTDWTVEEGIVRQFIEEPLYKYVFTENIEATNLLDNTIKDIKDEEIYFFYSCVTNGNVNPIQILYDPSHKYEVDDDGIIVDSDIFNYSINLDKYPEDLVKTVDISHRGKRLARSVRTAYDTNTGKTVTLYNKDGDDTGQIYYCYTDVEYITQTFVQNIFVQGENFSSISEWYVPLGGTTDIAWGFVPEFDNSSTSLEDWSKVAKSCLIFSSTSVHNSSTVESTDTVRNTSFYTNLSYFLTKDESENSDGYNNLLADGNTEFVARSSTNMLNFRIYNMEKNEVVADFDFSNLTEFNDYKSGRESEGQAKDIYAVTAKLEKDIIYEKIESYFIEVYINEKAISDKDTKKYTVSVSDIELFKKVNNGDDYIRPGQILTYVDENGNKTIASQTKTLYYMYKKGEKPSNFIDSLDGYTEMVDNNYTKIRSIEGSASNMFDLIQSVNETFECWTNFKIKRNSDGSIMTEEDYILIDEDEIYDGYTIYYKDDDGNYTTENPTKYPSDELFPDDSEFLPYTEKYIKKSKQLKSIEISETIGEDKSYGFNYGLNTNSVQRTINSDNIVTKLIVPNNSNEYGKNGYCSITRADENTSGANFLINFDYYIKIGLLDEEVVKADLYGINGKGLAYLTKYSKYNKLINDIYNDDLEKNEAGLSSLSIEVITEKANYITAYQSYIAYEQEVAEKAKALCEEYDLESIDELTETNLSSMPSDTKGDIEGYFLYKKSYSDLEEKYKNAELLYNDTLNKIAQKEALVEEYQTIIKKLDKAFYQKYQRYIKEGTWSSDDYYDDNLYYYDALSSLYISKSPEITYTINIVDISLLDDFKFYTFNIGDRTFVYDKEIFGDKKEDVVVTGITYNLEDPTSNSITVQNYRTEFADLFSKFAATVTQVELKQGSWDKGANLVDTNGILDVNTLQESLKNGGDFYNVALSGVHFTSEGIIIGSMNVTPTKVSM